MRETITRFFWSLFFYFVSAFGMSLTIIATIGVSSFNSFTLSVSQLSSVKVGTLTIVVNLVFLFFCWLTDHQRKVINYLFVGIALIFFGTVVNLFVYGLFSGLLKDAYFLRLVWFILGVIIAGIGTGQVVRLKFLQFPIEHLCLILSEKTEKSFAFYRYMIDFLFLAASLLMTVAIGLPLFVREGTLISLFLLSFIISRSKEFTLLNKKKKASR